MKRTLALVLCVLVLLISSCNLSKKGGASLPAGNTSSATATLSSSPDATSQSPAAATPAPIGSESDQLIDTALAKGEINQETALVYKVYAQFTDARLPSQYRGKVNLNTDSHIIDQVEAEFPTLSPQAQANLIPYLVPPVYEGSWAPPAASGTGQVTTIKLPCSKIEVDRWASETAAKFPVRFWWLKSRPGDKKVADAFKGAMDGDIWSKLTGLMGHTPLDDTSVQCNGGGADFDIYITPQVERSYAAAYYPPGCKHTPSYIVANPAISNAILAHEFMHAIQWSYATSADCMYPGEYAWLAEATAAWAQDYVYPGDNAEHQYVPWFYESDGAGKLPTLNVRNDAHEYGAYLFFSYLTHHFNNPGLVKVAWDKTTTMKSVDAVDKAIPGGLDSVWGDFAITNLIEPPHDEYQKWDQLTTRPSGKSLIKDQLRPNTTYTVADQINHLSIMYEWYTFTDDTRLVSFYNGLSFKLDNEPINTYLGVLPINDGTLQYQFTALDPKDVEGLKIQAYYKIAGDTGWQVEDWTQKSHLSFCRDANAERLTDLVIVTSNSTQDHDYTKTGAYTSLLDVSNVGCWRYSGNASFQSAGSGEGGAYTDQQTIPNVVFERTDASPDIPYPYLHFKVVEGQWNRTYDYKSTDGKCIGNGQANANLSAQTSSDLFILYGAINGPSARRYSGSANANQPIQVAFKCPDGSPVSPVPAQPWFYADVLSQVLPKVYTIPTGGILDGKDDLLGEVNGVKMAYQWHFEPQSEPAGAQGSKPPSSESTSPPPSGQANLPGGNNTVPPGQGNASLPGIPDYPHIQFSQQPAPGTLMIITDDTREDVEQFYTDQLTRLGWTRSPDQGNAGGATTGLEFTKDQSKISLVINGTDGQITFMISMQTQ